MSDIKFNLDQIVTEAVKKSGLLTDEVPSDLRSVTEPAAPPDPLVEAYVATVKPYRQVSEFVSQKTKDAHAELYKRYVDSLNEVSAKVDTADVALSNSNHSDFRSLKLDETFNLNAVWLHELFFANVFDPNSEITMDSIAFMRLQRDWGTFDAWQSEFIACANACGEGWAICGYNIFLRRYVNVIVSHHSCDIPLGLYPVIVLDMWAHSYYRDYLSDKASYITAMMREFNWVTIEERFNVADKIMGVSK